MEKSAHGTWRRTPTVPTQDEHPDELEKHAELKDKGVITQEEFEAKKKLLLEL